MKRSKDHPKETKNTTAQKQVLHSAVKENKLGFVKLLHANGTDLNSVDKRGKTALMLACKMGFREIVDFLVKNGVDVNRTDNDGMTAVHESAQYGQLETLKILTTAGADVNVSTRGGQTSMHFAANGNYFITSYLLSVGAISGIRDTNDLTPLHWALASKDPNIKLVEELLRVENYNNVNDVILPPAFMAARSGNLKILQYLVDKGADLLVTAGVDDSTVMHQAAEYDKTEIVRYLLENGFEADGRDGDGWTSLHFASAKGYLNLAALLLSSGANIEAKTLKGSTPLKLAILNGARNLIEFLICNNADVNAIDDQGYSVLDYIAKIKDVETVKFIVENGLDLEQYSRKDSYSKLNRNTQSLIDKMNLKKCDSQAFKNIEIKILKTKSEHSNLIDL